MYQQKRIAVIAEFPFLANLYAGEWKCSSGSGVLGCSNTEYHDHVVADAMTDFAVRRVNEDAMGIHPWDSHIEDWRTVYLFDGDGQWLACLTDHRLSVGESLMDVNPNEVAYIVRVERDDSSLGVVLYKSASTSPLDKWVENDARRARESVKAEVAEIDAEGEVARDPINGYPG